MNDGLSTARRRTYEALIVIIAALNVLDLTGIWNQPVPVPAALFALNVVLFVRLAKAGRFGRIVIVRRDR